LRHEEEITFEADLYKPEKEGIDDQGYSELKGAIIGYILEVIERIKHYYGSQRQRV
jgi:hypothetical protein